MFFEHTSKKLVHKTNKLRYWSETKLTKLDGIPSSIRKPLGIFIIFLGVIFFFIPITKGLILMFIGARMLTKHPIYHVLRFAGMEKRYPNPRIALFHTLK